MNEKPILFSTEMVRAILDGRKTQTRRVIKPQIEYRPEHPTHKVRKPINQGNIKAEDYFDFASFIRRNAKHYVGDILWVRETWRETDVISQPYAYKADEENITLVGDNGDVITVKYHYKPSTRMPKKAARLFLKITDVRVERLQEISEADAKCEGIRSFWLHKEHGGEWHESNSTFIGVSSEQTFNTRCKAYRNLWDNLNAKRGYSWDSNPWVWVYEFERVD